MGDWLAGFVAVESVKRSSQLDSSRHAASVVAQIVVDSCRVVDRERDRKCHPGRCDLILTELDGCRTLVLSKYC